jgi:hypothetical protein
MLYFSYTQARAQYLLMPLAAGYFTYMIHTTRLNYTTWVAHMIMKTLDSACLLLEIRWQKGRQADKMRTWTHSPPTFLAAPSNFLSLPSTQFL